MVPYRYAERSKTSRLEWSKFTKDYFLKRETLANVLLLVDASVPTQVLGTAEHHMQKQNHASIG